MSNHLIEQWATEEELADMKLLVGNAGWNVLIRMLRKLEINALRDLQTFKDHDEALEKRGFSNGVSKVVSFITPLGGGISSDRPLESRTRRPGESTAAESESESERPADFAY